MHKFSQRKVFWFRAKSRAKPNCKSQQTLSNFNSRSNAPTTIFDLVRSCFQENLPKNNHYRDQSDVRYTKRFDVVLIVIKESIERLFGVKIITIEGFQAQNTP